MASGSTIGAIVIIIIGIILLIIGIVIWDNTTTLAPITPIGTPVASTTNWWSWGLIIFGILLILVGGIWLAFSMSGPSDEAKAVAVAAASKPAQPTLPPGTAISGNISVPGGYSYMPYGGQPVIIPAI
jgi:amino acid transporter